MNLTEFIGKEGVFFMDLESIYRLGLSNISSIDLASSDERYDSSTNNHIIELRLKKELEVICPCCGTVNDSIVRSSRITTIKHSSGLEDNIVIKLHRRIYKCNSCDKLFTESNNLSYNSSSVSYTKIMQILRALKDRFKSFNCVANDFNLSPTKVIQIFDNHVNITRQELSEVICVDEVYSKHCGYHKFCFIIYNPRMKKIIDVLPSRHLNDLIDYFSHIPINERNNVKYFSTDLYEPYRSLAKLCLPNALICADHFHVIKNLQSFFNAARINIMKKYKDMRDDVPEYYWLYKKYWRLLNKNPEKLRWKRFKVSHSGMMLNENEIVSYMLSINKDLADAYELIVEYKVFNSTATIDNAKEKLDNLMIKFHNSKLKEMRQGHRLLKNWYQEIINSYNKINGHLISNGNIERANRNTKDLIRTSYGFSNFERFRNRVLYTQNDDAPIKLK